MLQLLRIVLLTIVLLPLGYAYVLTLVSVGGDILAATSGWPASVSVAAALLPAAFPLVVAAVVVGVRRRKALGRVR